MDDCEISMDLATPLQATSFLRSFDPPSIPLPPSPEPQFTPSVAQSTPPSVVRRTSDAESNQDRLERELAATKARLAKGESDLMELRNVLAGIQIDNA